MRTTHSILVAVMLSAAWPVLAEERDRAVPRGGGAQSSRDAGGRHTPSSQSGAAPSGPSVGQGGNQSGLTDAQRRHPRPGGGRPTGYPGYPGYSGWGWYGPAYWGYWWPYAYYGWYPYGGSPWGVGYSVPSVGNVGGSIRVLVDPPGTRVYVDGYYVGVAEEFDGLLERLHVPMGTHEISFRLEGHRTWRVRVWVGASGTLKLDHEMEEGTGETFEDLAGDVGRREGPRPGESRGGGYAPGPPGEAAHGLLRLTVEPDDASVYVDGSFRGPGRDVGPLPLPPGPHRVEVVRPGYRTEEREVDLAPDEPVDLTVVLQPR